LGIIYGLVCPLTGEIRYVGQTISETAVDRLQDHIRSSFYDLPRYTHKEYWIRKVHTKETPVTVVVLDSVPNEELDEKERFWILHLSNLTNAATGGTAGYTYTDEVKAVISASKQGEKNPSWGKHPQFSDEWCRNISTGLRNSDKLKRSRSSAGFRARISEVQSIHSWLILDENRQVVAQFKNAREVAEHFSHLLNKTMSVGNVKNARRFKRAIGKQLGTWYYVAYEGEEQSHPLSKPRIGRPKH